MRYFRIFWTDIRQTIAEYPDLLVIAAVVSIAFITEHYFRIPLKADPAARPAMRMLIRSAIFCIIPLVSLPLLRLTPAAVGLRVGTWRKWLTDVLLLYILMLPVLLWAARQPQFSRVYPYFSFARVLPTGFLLAQLVRLIGMFAWEFIIRGYLLFGFARRVGVSAAIAVQLIPFTILHFGKPLPETAGSVVAGVVLGILAIRGRSFVPCAILHFAIAATLDAFVVIKGSPANIY